MVEQMAEDVSGRTSAQSDPQLLSISAENPNERSTPRPPVPRSRIRTVVARNDDGAAAAGVNGSAVPAVAPRRRSTLKCNNASSSGIPLPSARSSRASMADRRSVDGGHPSDESTVSSGNGDANVLRNASGGGERDSWVLLDAEGRVDASSPEKLPAKDAVPSCTGASGYSARSNTLAQENGHSAGITNVTRDLDSNVVPGGVEQHDSKPTVSANQVARPLPPPKGKPRLSVLGEGRMRTPAGNPVPARKPSPKPAVPSTRDSQCNGSVTRQEADSNEPKLDSATEKRDGRKLPAGRQRSGSGSVPQRAAPVRIEATSETEKIAQTAPINDPTTPLSPTTSTSRIPRPVSSPCLDEPSGACSVSKDKICESPALGPRRSQNLDVAAGRPRTPSGSGSMIPMRKAPELTATPPGSPMTPPRKADTLVTSPNKAPCVAAKPRPPVAAKTTGVKPRYGTASLRSPRSPSGAIPSKSPTLTRAASPATPKKPTAAADSGTPKESPSPRKTVRASPLTRGQDEKPAVVPEKDDQRASSRKSTSPEPDEEHEPSVSSGAAKMTAARRSKFEDPSTNMLSISLPERGHSPETKRAVSPTVPRKVFAMGLDASPASAGLPTEPAVTMLKETNERHTSQHPLPPKKRFSMPGASKPALSPRPDRKSIAEVLETEPVAGNATSTSNCSVVDNGPPARSSSEHIPPPLPVKKKHASAPVAAGRPRSRPQSPLVTNHIALPETENFESCDDRQDSAAFSPSPEPPGQDLVEKSPRRVPPPLPAKKKNSAPSGTVGLTPSPLISPEPDKELADGSGALDVQLQSEASPQPSPIKVKRSHTIHTRSPPPESPSPSPLPSPRTRSPVPARRVRSVHRDSSSGLSQDDTSAGEGRDPAFRVASPLLLEPSSSPAFRLELHSPSEDPSDKEDSVASPMSDNTPASSEAATEGSIAERSSMRRRSSKRRAPTPPEGVKPFSVDAKIKDTLGSGPVTSPTIGRRHSSPAASPLTVRAHSTITPGPSKSTGADALASALLSSSAPSTNAHSLLSDDDLLSPIGVGSANNSAPSSPRLRSKATSLPSLELSDEGITRSGSMKSTRRAPPPPRSVKSPPAIEEVPDEQSPSPVLDGPFYSGLTSPTPSSAPGSDDEEENRCRRASLSKKRAPPPPVKTSRAGNKGRDMSSSVNPYAIAVTDTKGATISMPSSPLLNRRPPPLPLSAAPSSGSPKSPRPLPKEPVAMPGMKRAVSESSLIDSPALPKRSADMKPAVEQQLDEPQTHHKEEAYGVKDVRNRVESPVYACIPDLDAGKQDLIRPDSETPPPRSESVSPVASHLSEEDLKQLLQQIETLEEELAVERKTQQSLQNMIRVLEGGKALEVTERLDQTDALIAELEKELQKLKEIESGERKLDHEQRVRLRKQVINELVTTEKDFVNDMQLCIICFLEPLREEDIVDTKVLFGNIEDLVDVARRFLKLLEANITGDDGGEAQVATCFTDMKDELSAVYAQYCRSHDDACDLLIKLDSNTEYQEKVVKLSDDMRNLHNAKTWDLQSFLIKPVQRVLKYPLLLRELAKYTEFNHPDKKNLKQAVALMGDVARDINEFKRRKDLMTKYKKSTEEAAKVGMGKLTWHSVTKKTSRFTQKIGQATGFTSSTIDKKFHDEEVLFRELDRATRQMLKNIQEHVQLSQEMNALAQKLLTSSKNLYDDSTDNSFGVYAQAKTFQMGKVFTDFMSDLKAGVTDRLEALIGQYETPRFFIDKRNDKLLDFDSCKNRVDKYKMDPERLKEFKEELKGKQREYEAMNAQLLEDLPKLVTVCLKILLKLLARWENLQQQHCLACYQLFSDLDALALVPKDISSADALVEEHTQLLFELHEKWKDFKILPRGWIDRSLSASQGSVRSYKSLASYSGSMDSLNASFGRRSSAESVSSGSMGNLSMDSNFSVDRRMVGKKRISLPPYMRQDTGSSQVKLALVEYDFDAENDTEITVSKGTTVQIVSKVDSDWWKIRHDGSEGLIPASYVSDSGVSDVDTFSRQSSASSLLPAVAEKQPRSKPRRQEEPAYAEANFKTGTPAVNTSGGVTSVTPYHAVSVLEASSDSGSSVPSSASTTPAACMSPEPGDNDKEVSSGSRSGRTSASSMSAMLPVYRVAFDFEAESNTEITLEAGELVNVLQDHDTTGNSDWWLVSPNNRNQRGYVPSSYLEELGSH